MRTVFLSAAFLVLVVATPETTVAQTGSSPSNGPSDQPSTPALVLHDVIEHVLAANPTLDAARQRLEAASAAAIELDALPDPRIRTGFYAVPFPSVDMAGGQLRLQLSQEFPYPGTLDRRVAVAERETERQSHVVESTQVRLAAAARRAYYELYFAQRAQRVHHQHLALVRELSSSAEARYATGSAPQENVLRALQELTGLFTQLADIDARLGAARARLNALRRHAANAPVSRVLPPRPNPEGLPLEDALAASNANPRLADAKTAIEREAARVAAERHEAKPDFGVTAEWWSASDGMGGRFERYALLATITLPWANGAKYEAAVARASADRLAAVADWQARQDDVRRDVVAAWERSRASARIVQLYVTTLLPQSETTLQAARSAYETGTDPFVAVIDAERALLLNRLGLARAEADFGVAEADLAEAIGVIYLPTEEPLR